VAKVGRHVRWWQQQGREDGTIASLGFSGVTGRDFAGDAEPPRLGLFLVSMPVADSAGRCRRAAAAGAAYVRRPAPLVRAGGENSMSCTLRTPSGSLLELYTPEGSASRMGATAMPNRPGRR
jgi:hypothetical protein